MRKFLLLILIAAFSSSLFAAPFQFLKHTITQPNGEVIECFVSGDEFFNWIHDKDGYTIIQDSDGYYYYAVQKNGKIMPTSHRVNTVKPESLGVKKWIKISGEEYKERKNRYELPESLKSEGQSKAPHTGALNNIVIYIRFSDDAEITKIRQTYDDMMNSTSSYSLKSYFDQVSYGNLNINSTHYPACASPTTSNASYQDSHPRSYFRPYNATTNPNGYQTDNEAAQREHQLLYDAITWINANNPIDIGLNIDGDNDGKVDNVCFMIKGNSDGWSDLLWAHRWVLYTKNVSINGKRVYDYTFQPENQAVDYVLCHEMFHALGAPDLYHYNENSFSPVGGWDLMESGKGHMGAYMKWKYAGAKWITSIPEITTSGTYTLNPLSSPTNNCYKIASPNSDKEFFVLEYRKKEGLFENYLPGSGLLVYRINSDFDGNADFDNVSVFDEVYIYRPNGTTYTNGTINSAHFSANLNKTSINDATNPSSFLSNGLPGGLDISEISTSDQTISFYVYKSSMEVPANFAAAGVSESQINLTWALNTSSNDVIVAFSTTGIIGSPVRGTSYAAGSAIPGGGVVLYTGNATSFNHGSLIPGTSYTYKIWSKNSSNEYSTGVIKTASTNCTTPSLPFTQGFNSSTISPCWTVTTVTIGATQEEPAAITAVQSSQTPSANPYEGTHMIKFNSTYCGVGNALRLESPAFSTVGQSTVKVSFAWHRDTQWPTYLDNMKIQWSANGTDWNVGTTYQRYHTVIGWTLQTYELPAAALGLNSVKLGFLFTSEYGYNCYLDDIRISGISTAIPDNSLDEVSVYPNPSKGLFTINPNTDYKKMSVQVFDQVGRIVNTSYYNDNQECNLDLTFLNKGIYILKIEADGRTINRKVIIE